MTTGDLRQVRFRQDLEVRFVIGEDLRSKTTNRVL
jgi:hypothetical protein